MNETFNELLAASGKDGSITAGSGFMRDKELIGESARRMAGSDLVPGGNEAMVKAGHFMGGGDQASGKSVKIIICKALMLAAGQKTIAAVMSSFMKMSVRR